ncbi:MAG TPA: hypothetical protein VLQ79_14250 [Myxococcaceae bacterium]|nr:hypothetical protein [Myxococcaceae bacterium]
MSARRSVLGARRMPWSRVSVALGLAVLLVPGPSGAWIYPEHRDILARALLDLPPEQQQLFAALWADARTGRESRYCTSMVDGDGRSEAVCIDLAAWAGIAGDHSCSPDLLLTTTLPSDWILNVASVSALTKVGLEKATDREQKQNQVAINNLRLQFVDRDYTTRAGANNGHFLATRTSDDTREYLERTLGPGSEPNALGLYLYSHLGAIGLVRQWAATTDPVARAALAREVLATEAFALHFLEDTFAAGHVAGSWGSAAERKGTHDYYSEFGLDTSAWNGTHFTLLGDAYMRPEDLTRTARVVAMSLGQLFDATREGTPSAAAAGAVTSAAASAATAFNACTATKQATDTLSAENIRVALQVARETPIPGRGPQDVHLPHFRQEIGPFVGFSGDLTGGLEFGGFQSGNANPRWWGGAEIEFRIGVGLEALTASTGAGQAFLGIGFTYDTPQSGGSQAFETAGVPVVPARQGLTFRLRVPFYVFPFDLLLAAPILSWAAPDTMINMGIVAASGGLLPWQRAFVTRYGAFQFLLGREVGVTLFGYFGNRVEGIGGAAPGATVPYASNLVFLSYRVLSFDFPTFEYRPLREFATNQALTFAVQLGWGVEFPNQVRYVSKLTFPPASGPVPDLAPGWQIYLRIHFDARYYF